MKYISDGEMISDDFDGIAQVSDSDLGLVPEIFVFSGSSAINNSLMFEGPIAHFALFQTIPAEVQAIKISSNQSKDVIDYEVGAERKISVYIVTI
jgi:hypothetical protein